VILTIGAMVKKWLHIILAVLRPGCEHKSPRTFEPLNL
jgi:hypothetical protein